MKGLILFLTILISMTSRAQQCATAMTEAKRLESMVTGVYYTSESDDFWTAFSSKEAITANTDEEIKRVLNGKIIDPDNETYEPTYRIENDSEAYKFLNWELDSLVHYASDNPEDDSPERFQKLINSIKEKYGKNIRLIQYGHGDGRSIFIGYHAIIMIMDNGCVFGLKVFTVWT